MERDRLHQIRCSNGEIESFLTLAGLPKTCRSSRAFVKLTLYIYIQGILQTEDFTHCRPNVQNSAITRTVHLQLNHSSMNEREDPHTIRV